MSEDDSFLRAIQADPEDWSTRLIYADWLEERGDARGEYLRLEGLIAASPALDERTFAARRRMLQLRSSISPTWMAEMGVHRTSGDDQEPGRLQLVAEALGRPEFYQDEAGYHLEIVGGAVHPLTHAVAFVQSRSRQVRPDFLDIAYHLHLRDTSGGEVSQEVETYNPFFGCEVRFLEWYGNAVLLIYVEKHRTYICRFGMESPARFHCIEHHWILDGPQLGYWGYQETSVRRLAIPSLEELPALSEEAAAQWGLLPEKFW